MSLFPRAASLLFTLLHTLLFTLLLAAGPARADSAPGAAAERAAARTESRLAQLAQTRRALAGVSAEGASVIAWRDGRAVVKIAVEALGERGKRLADFYYADGRLVLAHLRRIDYGADIAESLQGKTLRADVVEEHRLAFAGGRLVQWLEGGQPVAAGDTRWRTQQADTLAEARAMQRLMQTAAPAGRDCEWSCSRPQGAGCARYRCN